MVVSSFKILPVNHCDSFYTGSGVIKCFKCLSFCFLSQFVNLHNSTCVVSDRARVDGSLLESVNSHHKFAL